MGLLLLFTTLASIRSTIDTLCIHTAIERDHLNCTGELRTTYPIPFPDAVNILGLYPAWEYRSLNQKYDREQISRVAGPHQKENAFAGMYVSATRTCPEDEKKAFLALLVTFYGT